MNEQFLNQSQSDLDQFKRVVEDFDWKPATNRTCTNKFFLFIFIAIVMLTAYMLAITIPHNQIVLEKYKVLPLIKQKQQSVIKIIICMVILSLVLSRIFLYLLQIFPHQMIHFIVYFSASIILLLAIYSFSIARTLQGAISLIMLIFFLCIFWCFKEHVEAAINLAKATAFFLNKAPQTYMLPIITSIVTILFTILAAMSISGIVKLYLIKKIHENQLETYLSIWLFLYIFFVFIFYYTMVFLIAWNAAQWHYQSKDQSIWYSFKILVIYHLGSITMASTLITFIKILQIMIQIAKTKEQNQNIVSKFLLCLIQCCVDQMQYFTKILNRNAIIFMTLTGKDYVDSAKHAGNLIFDNYDRFAILQIVSQFLIFTELIICIGIPIFISLILIHYYKIDKFTTYIVMFIFLFSLLISIVFLSTFNESLSSLFLFQCFDKKLLQFNKRRQQLSDNFLAQLRDLFKSSFRTSSHDPSGGDIQMNAFNKRSHRSVQHHRDQHQNFGNNPNNYNYNPPIVHNNSNQYPVMQPPINMSYPHASYVNQNPMLFPYNQGNLNEQNLYPNFDEQNRQRYNNNLNMKNPYE